MAPRYMRLEFKSEVGILLKDAGLARPGMGKTFEVLQDVLKVSDRLLCLLHTRNPMSLAKSSFTGRSAVRPTRWKSLKVKENFRQ